MGGLSKEGKTEEISRTRTERFREKSERPSKGTNKGNVMKSKKKNRSGGKKGRGTYTGTLRRRGGKDKGWRGPNRPHGLNGTIIRNGSNEKNTYQQSAVSEKTSGVTQKPKPGKRSERGSSEADLWGKKEG